MRALIISEIDGSLRKLVRVTEHKGGIYVFFYGPWKTGHLAYHLDGTVLMKNSSSRTLHYYYSRNGNKIGKSRDEKFVYVPMGKRLPIEEIEKFIIITTYGIPLDKAYEEAATDDYVRSKDANAIIYINPEIIKRQKILNIIPCIVHKGFEKECIEHFHKSYRNSEEQTFEVLNANFFKLDNFQGFLVGIILSGGKYLTVFENDNNVWQT
jgi:hypothetical protein